MNRHTVAITGVNGFVGSVLKDFLLKQKDVDGVCQGSCRVSEFHTTQFFVAGMNRPFDLLTD